MITHEYHLLMNGKSVQLIETNGKYFACLSDVILGEPRILEAKDFDTLFDASMMVSSMIKAQTGLHRKREAMGFSPFMDLIVDNDNESLI
jgi:hypothetical protein